MPTKEWQGKSGLNAHADFVMQTDHSYGQVFKALKENGLLGNTLVICSADNGTSARTSNMDELKSKGHFPSAGLRGSKADLWDGGHRVPFIVSWKGHVEAGSKSDKLVCLTDLLATAADVVGAELPASEGVDSISMLPLLTGKGEHQRGDVIHHSISGFFSIRQGKWELLLTPRPEVAAKKGEPMIQLYDMEADLGEQNNLAAKMPEKVKELRALLENQIVQGRSTVGAAQNNDVAIDVEKLSRFKQKAKKNAKKKSK